MDVLRAAASRIAGAIIAVALAAVVAEAAGAATIAVDARGGDRPRFGRDLPHSKYASHRAL